MWAMSDYPPSPAAPVEYAGYNQPNSPQATSSAAVAGFVCSLVCCVPILTQLAGFILGIIGIANTSAGKARGRWMAVSALIISPLVAIGWVVATVILVKLTFGMMGLAMKLEPVLAATEANLPALVSQLHENAFSSRLQVRVDEEAVLAFLGGVKREYGSIVSLTGNPQAPISSSPDAQSSIIQLDASFEKDGTQSEIEVEVTLGFDGYTPKIDNIKIGELELAPEQ